ncbi:hypothetical protein [Jiella marina]|uniref:hypothetical protein n=1 Tax=Jiella sp. LLJ827 TaxID=2917712 RepID=UPI00210152BC|nr:hypothetical protein [Jiella sp. LLJ827]MCQ0989254.1 hypothetical protein [Jiella sp. LLJ827]
MEDESRITDTDEAGVSANSNPFQTLSTMRQTKTVAKAVSADREGVFFQNAAGELEILAIGTDLELNRIKRDAASDTGWSLQATGISAYALAKPDPSTADANTPIFAVIKGGDGRPAFARMEYEKETDSFRPAQIGGEIITFPLATDVISFAVLQDPKFPDQFQLTATVVSGTVYKSCYVRTGSFAQPTVKPLWFYETALLGGSKVQTLSRFRAPSGGDTSDYSFLTIAGRMLTTYLPSHVHPTPSFDDLDVVKDVTPGSVPAPTTARLFEIAGASSEAPEVFLIDDEKTLKCATGAPADASDNATIWPSNYQTVPTTTQFGDTVSITKLKAVRLGNGLPTQLFGLAKNGTLLHFPRQADGTWLPVVDTGVPASNIAVTELGDAGQDDDSAVRVAAVSSSGDLRLLRITTAGEYIVEPIDFEDDQTAKTLTDVYRYTTRLVVTDENGLPQPKLTVMLKSSTELAATVNNVQILLPNAFPIAVTTDGLGHLTIIADLNEQLGAPSFSLESDAFPDGPMTTSPQETVRSVLRDVSGDMLQAATDPASGQPVIPDKDGKTNYGDIASALNKAMQPASKFDDFAPLDVNIQALDVAGSGFSVDFTDDGIRTSDVADEDFEAFWGAAAEIEGTRDFEEPLGFFHGVNWGAAWRAIKDGLVKATKVVIKGARAVITIAGKAYRFTLKAARDFFDFAQALLEIAGAAFGRLVGWLLKELGFFTDWVQVIKNKNALKRYVKAKLPVLIGRLPDPAGLKPMIDQYFMTFENDLEQLFMTANAVLGERNRTLGAAAKGRYNQMPSRAALRATTAMSGPPIGFGLLDR